MITPDDIVTIRPTLEQCRIAWANAKEACIGGHSAVRNDKKERSDKLLNDQMIGQLGHMVGSIYLFESIDPYVEAREYANTHPFKGDSGADFLFGPNLDVKTSQMRRSKDPLTYNFLLRPRERHLDNLYLQALVEDLPGKDELYEVHLVGWCWEHEVPCQKTYGGIFDGAYVLPVVDLNPLPKILNVLADLI